MPKQKSKKVKILLTGGHAATTAIATTEELIRRTNNKVIEIYWVGSKKAVEGKDMPTLESWALHKLKVSYHPIVMGRIQRKFTLWTIPSLAKIPLGFLHATYLLLKIKPDVVVSFGGYAAFPVVVMGWILRIPSILHEQTLAVGRANKYSSWFVTKIAVARSESLPFFPKDKVVITGNPVMTQILDVEVKDKIGNPPVIFITGGSRGAQAINNVFEKILPELLKTYKIIHHTGYLDYEKFTNLRSQYKKSSQERYEVYSSIDPLKMDDIYRESDIIVARAGANTVSEIMVVKRPSILIPLPIAYKDEQLKNARFAQKYGIARVILQSELTPDGMLKDLNYVRKNWGEIVGRVVTEKSPDINAASSLVDLIKDIIK